MKQTIFMIALSIFGIVGLLHSAMSGVMVYYLFAVLRPQYIWMWALPVGVQWSQIVAIPTIVAALMYYSSRPPSARSFTAVHGVVLLFVLWLGGSYLTAYNKFIAWGTYFVYLKLFVMFFVAAMVIRTVRDVWRLMIITALALSYIAYEVNYLYFSTGYIAIYFNGYGGLDNNGAGLMLAMGVPLCIFIYMATNKWWRWAFAAFIPMLLHAVLMTFSRGAMIALLLAAPLIFFRGKHKGQLALAALAIAITIPFLAGQEIREEFFSVERYQEDGSAQSRFESWRAAYLISLDYPIFGVGIRNSDLFSNMYGADREGRAIHNQFLQILADSGYPALFLYVTILVLVGLSLRRMRKLCRPREDEEAKRAYAIACGVEGSLAVFLIGGMFLSLEVFELPYLLLLLGAQLPLTLGQAEVPDFSEFYPARPLRTAPSGASAASAASATSAASAARS